MIDTVLKVEPIYKTLIHATDTLKTDGYADDRIIDAMLGITLSWSHHLHGSRNVAQRLYVLALNFSAEADRQEGIASDVVH